VSEKTRQEIFIEKGMSNNQRITLTGAGDQEPGLPAGDVVFVLKTKPHDSFQRSGNDLLTEASITLSEALLGFSRILITHLDGRGVKVTSPPGKVIKPDATLVLKGEGMPIHKRPESKGDLYIVLHIEMPSETWMQSIDKKALEVVLPPKKEDLDPPPEVVDEVPYVESELSSQRGPGADFLAQLAEEDEDAWVDEDEDEEPECRTQ